MQRRNFLWYSTLFLTGCAAGSTFSERSPSTPQLPATLRFAVTEVEGLERLQAGYNDLRIALADALQRDIEFFPVDNYMAAAVALKQGDVDLALAGPSEYVVITSRTNAVPVLAIPQRNYRSVIAVHQGSEAKTVADLRGKTLAMSDIGSTSGHLGPTKILIDAGLDPKTDVKIRMLGDNGSVEAMKQGIVDAWGGSGNDYNDFLKDTENSFPILIEGPPLPSDVFIMSSSLEPSLVDVVREQLLANQASLVESLAIHHSKYQGSQMMPAKDEDYDLIRDVYRAIGQGDFVL